jgi:hypothetical protein
LDYVLISLRAIQLGAGFIHKNFILLLCFMLDTLGFAICRQLLTYLYIPRILKNHGHCEFKVDTALKDKPPFIEIVFSTRFLLSNLPLPLHVFVCSFMVFSLHLDNQAKTVTRLETGYLQLARIREQLMENVKKVEFELLAS